ncbi:MAG: hypothetical protein GX682_04710 [Clostridiaceae bacterium]|nr:hypothetical protein [Clostridiaceae bacterium]
MENASKALIIAGSILISIVIITLGVMIVGNVTDTIQKNSNLSEQEISTYNQPFEAYLGTKSGTQVRSLCDKVRNHNNASIDDVTRQIVLQEGDASNVTAATETAVTASAVNTIKQNIKQGKTYTISLGYDANSGLVVAVGIEEKK